MPLSNGKALFFMTLSCWQLLDARCAGESSLRYSINQSDTAEVGTTTLNMIAADLRVSNEISSGSAQNSVTYDLSTLVAAKANTSEMPRHVRATAKEHTSTVASTTKSAIDSEPRIVSDQEKFQTTNNASLAEESIIVTKVPTTLNAGITPNVSEIATKSFLPTLEGRFSKIPSEITSGTSTDLNPAGNGSDIRTSSVSELATMSFSSSLETSISKVSSQVTSGTSTDLNQVARGSDIRTYSVSELATMSFSSSSETSITKVSSQKTPGSSRGLNPAQNAGAALPPATSELAKMSFSPTVEASITKDSSQMTSGTSTDLNPEERAGAVLTSKVTELATVSFSSTLEASVTNFPSEIAASKSTDLKTMGLVNAARSEKLSATAASTAAPKVTRNFVSTKPVELRDNIGETTPTNTALNPDKKVGHVTDDINHSSTRGNPALVLGVIWASTVAVAIVVAGLIRRRRSVRSVTLAFPSAEHYRYKSLRKVCPCPDASEPRNLSSTKGRSRPDTVMVEMQQCNASVATADVKQCHQEVLTVDAEQDIPAHSAINENQCHPQVSTAAIGENQCRPETLTVGMEQRPLDNAEVDVKQCGTEASTVEKGQCPPKIAPIDAQQYCLENEEAVISKQSCTEMATVDIEQCLG